MVEDHWWTLKWTERLGLVLAETVCSEKCSEHEDSEPKVLVFKPSLGLSDWLICFCVDGGSAFSYFVFFCLHLLM